MSKQTLQNSVQSNENISIPDEINSSTAKLVYVYLKSVVCATLEQLCSSLSMKKITIYPIISTLTKKGYITKSDNKYSVTV